MANVLRNLPSVAELLESPPLKSLVHRVNRTVVVSRVRHFLDDLREQVQSAAASAHVPAPAELAQRIAEWIVAEQQPPLAPLVNATGNIVPSHLGRAPLAKEATDAVAAVAGSYASVELDAASGERQPRWRSVESLLVRWTGAEAATVVNSHAAAIFLSLVALAEGREALVARGQLGALAGDCSLPEMIEASGARLRGVGAVNRASVADFAAARGPQSAVLIHAPPGEYALTGAIEQPTLAELAAYGHRESLPVLAILANATLLDLLPYGLTGQPIVRDSVEAGADLVLFRGDHWVGGPQCGIVAGRQALIDRLTAHPLYRALDADKMTLAALAATLRLYRETALAERSIPTLTLLATPLENLQQRAERLAPQLAVAGVASVGIATGMAEVGGVSLPGQMLPTVCLALTPNAGTAESLAAALRAGLPAVLGRLENDRVLLDLRSVPPRDDILLVAALENIASPPSAGEAL
jgi:L-seryl-tRNA(Ser) seleniumtransferase